MGVDYCQCDGCDSGMRDDSEYLAWCDCGCNFCDAKCGKVQNYITIDMIQKLDYNDSANYAAIDSYNGGQYHIDPNQSITCCICRKEKITDYVLMQYLLKLTGLTKEQATKKWRQDPEE